MGVCDGVVYFGTPDIGVAVCFHYDCILLGCIDITGMCRFFVIGFNCVVYLRVSVHARADFVRFYGDAVIVIGSILVSVFSFISASSSGIACITAFSSVFFVMYIW